MHRTRKAAHVCKSERLAKKRPLFSGRADIRSTSEMCQKLTLCRGQLEPCLYPQFLSHFSAGVASIVVRTTTAAPRHSDNDGISPK